MIFGYTMHRCLCTKHTVTDFPQNSTFSNLNLTMPLLLSIFTQNFTSLGLKVPSPRVAVHHALPEGIMHRTRNADHSILINNRLVLGSSTPKPPPSLLRKNVFYHPDEGTFFREINFTKIFTLVLWQYASFFFFLQTMKLKSPPSEEKSSTLNCDWQIFFWFFTNSISMFVLSKRRHIIYHLVNLHYCNTLDVVLHIFDE